MKKAISVLLCVIMAFALVQPCFAIDDIITEEYFYPEDYMTTPIYDESSDIDWDAVFDAIEEGISAHEKEIDLQRFKISYDRDNPNRNTLYDFLFYSPKFLDIVASYGCATIDNALSYISVNYRFSAEEYQSRLYDCELAVQKIIVGIKDNQNLSDSEKVLLVHDRLNVWNEYDKINLNNHTIPRESYSAYGALALGTSVCQGYALALIWILDELGIECYYNRSAALNHGWNTVIIDGKPYHLDATFDDPTWDKYGKCNHKNVLESTEMFLQNHNTTTVDFDSSPVDTSYDNYFWKDSASEFQLIGDNLYYVVEGNVYCRSLDSDADMLLFKVNDTWKPTSSTYYKNSYTCLASYGTKLVYNDTKHVYTYDVDSQQTETIYTLSPSLSDKYILIYGMAIRDGKIYLDIFNNANFVAETRENRIIIDLDCAHESKVVVNSTESTCVVPGKMDYVCTVCRGAFKDADAPLSDHSYDDGVVTTEPTCTTEGVLTISCKNCDASHTKVIPATNHPNQYGTKGLSATCTEDGFTGGIYCPDCKIYLSGHEVIPMVEHSYDDGIVTTKPTCTTEGVLTISCKNCDASHTKVIPATNHPNQYGTKGLSATCTEEGFTGGIYCPDCKIYLSGHEVIPMVEHSYDDGIVTTKPTCTTEGVLTISCKNCDASYTKVIPATNHPNQYGTKGLSATCTEDGFTGGIYCPDCKIYLSGHEVILSVGHTDSNVDGICDVCGDALFNIDPSDNCSCNCHKSGFIGFIWKIINIFQKIFKTNPTCRCGVAHY